MKLMFKDIQGQLGRIEGAVDRTEKHAIHTNGRVSKLEKWQYAIMSCISLFSAIILPLLIYSYFSSQKNLKYEILNGKDLTMTIENIIDKNYSANK